MIHYVYTTPQEVSNLIDKEEPMNRRFEYIALFAICVLILAVIGCAIHTRKHDQRVEKFYRPWLDQSFEEFLNRHPDPRQSIAIGQGNHRHTYVYDTKSQLVIGINPLAGLGETNMEHDDYYYIYVYVNGAGVIYKIDYRRMSEEW